MKDSEFIELLNLYLDHEIESSDAARLESEVQQNPERRKIYRQYCAMQKACTELADSYADVEVPEPKVVAFSPRRQPWYPAALAAAACLTVFLFIRSHQASETAPAGASVAVAAPAKPADEVPLTKVPLAPAVNAAQTQALAANDASFAWLKNAQLAPVNVNLTGQSPLKVEARTAPATAGAPLPSFQSEKVDWVAFKLQRSN